MTPRTTAMLVALLAVAIPGVAHAEVMDKEPTLTETWVIALVAGCIGFVAWRALWSLGLLTAIVQATYFVDLILELHDPFVGPAILQEAGAGYVMGSYGAALAWVGLHALGSCLYLRKRKWRPADD